MIRTLLNFGKPICKTRSMTASKTIGTHSGTFHADESLACFLLLQTAQFRHAQIVRSRDPQVLDKLDILVDVGQVYDPAAHKYDHHQREFQDTLDEKHFIRLSSAGLIYKHFGREVLLDIVKNLPSLPNFVPQTPKVPSQSEMETLYQYMYENFVELFDGNDNGVPMYPTVLGDGTKLVPAYKDRSSIVSRVSRLNPWWNDTRSVDTDFMDSQFKKAVEMVGNEFVESVDFFVRSWLPARQLVESAFSKRKQLNPSGRVIYFETHCPWKEHLFSLEKDLDVPNDEKPIYAIYQDLQGLWRIQSIPLSPSSFENRLPLPSAWRGLRSSELQSVTNIQGASFVHASGFIGGANSKEDVLTMANYSLALGQPQF